MTVQGLDPRGHAALEQVLGYLNFSSGTHDPLFLRNMNCLFEIEAVTPGEGDLYRRVLGRLDAAARERQTGGTDVTQLVAVLQVLEKHVLPGYLEFHRDLLFHHSGATIFNAFFLAEACESVLRVGGPWSNGAQISRTVIGELNDYLGHRPIPTLENQKIEPFAHEAVRPIPLYVRGAGVAYGPAQSVLELALKMLEATDRDLLAAAYFDPDNLDELAIDPRAYDFDHPSNKRPNYHFGQWDPHQIDNRGFYRRYVIQDVTLSALLKRLDDTSGISLEELTFEAAAVLAGTILMATGVSGSGPDSHDSSVTLSNLLPRIARYRDEFYDRLLAKVSGSHAARLRAECEEKKQPFGGARQHLNTELARRRASQLEHVHLARIFARMGFAEAATRQANVVPTASARMLCQIDCWLTEADLAIRRGDPVHAKELMPSIMDLLHRGIECGAILDPRNILGFDAHFSLFPAMENSVHDHRADELVRLVEQICNSYARIWSEFAARDQKDNCRELSKAFQTTAGWWHQFAAHEVKSVDAVDSFDAYRAATRVAEALNLWHKGGAATGDVAFWAPHAEMFDSSRAYALVMEALLDKNDFVASLSLAVHWLSQAHRVPLSIGESSFNDLAERWLMQLMNLDPEVAAANRVNQIALARRMFDVFEANAEDFWEVPTFELSEPDKTSRNDAGSAVGDEEVDQDEDTSPDRFDAAYEEMVYTDTTDDGVDGPIFETGQSSHDELAMEAERLVDRTSFLGCLARLWKVVVISRPWAELMRGPDKSVSDLREAVARWRSQSTLNRERLVELLDAIHAYRIPLPRGDMDSMIEFDQRRATKESLLEQIVSTTVETTDAERILAAANNSDELQFDPAEVDQQEIARHLGLILHGDVPNIRANWSKLTRALAANPLLYVPLAKGGLPRTIVATRVRQRGIQDLLAFLPRLGLIRETCDLLDTARRMETDHPVGQGAVTEFDELFKRGYKSIVDSLVLSSQQWGHGSGKKREESASAALVNCLEKLTEALLLCWLNHSRTLRLSVMEKVNDKAAWQHLLEFIQKFGHDRFTQRFLNLGNIRTILHQGVASWLDQVAEQGDDEFGQEFVTAMEEGTSKRYIVEHLTLVLEAVFENYGEYRDYNSTTTQSDRGELIYTLLDFLRLRTRYDRVAWNLKPVIWAHEVLVRANQNSAAKMWRRALTDRINDEADQYLKKLADLQKKYAMRMPTVADRLAERFVRPMAIDRIRALVEPAIQEAAKDGSKRVFELLEHETESLTRQPTGVGLDVPAWLVALEEEVERVRDPLHHLSDCEELRGRIPQLMLAFADVQDQLDQLLRRNIDERKEKS